MQILIQFVKNLSNNSKVRQQAIIAAIIFQIKQKKQNEINFLKIFKIFSKNLLTNKILYANINLSTGHKNKKTGG